MASNNMQKQKTFLKIREESDLSLEVVILMVLGIFMLLFGLLLFGIHTRALPYTPDSTYGLFLVFVSIQMITMGKTPFADLRRSWALIIIGIGTAIIGMTAVFIPGILKELVRIMVGIMLFVGGISLFLQLLVFEDKARLWMKIPGILRQLTIACGLIYGLSVILGLITLLPGITTDPQTAALLIIYGIGFFYLSWCIQKATRFYQPEKTKNVKSGTLITDYSSSKGIFSIFQEASLPLSTAILIVLATLLTLLGFLLFPVFLGLIPFSPDGQLGLLLVIMAIQMMALGNTPIGPFKRSWLLIIIGMLFAILGIFSCIVPGILTLMISILIGLLNIIGGSLLLIKRFLPIVSEIKNRPAEPVIFTPTLKKLLVIQTLLNVVGIVFGLSMLVTGLISGIPLAGILVVYGFLLFVLAFILQNISQIQISEEQPMDDATETP